MPLQRIVCPVTTETAAQRCIRPPPGLIDPDGQPIRRVSPATAAMPEQHLFISLDSDELPFRVLLREVQEIIRLEGPFAHLDPTAASVPVRSRTVRIVDPTGHLGKRAEHASSLLVFESGHRLHGLPVTRVDREPLGGFRELRLADLTTP